MKIHPYAELFPALKEKELQELAEDIKVNGLQQSIDTDQRNRIVDGRNRLTACELVKTTPKFQSHNFDSDRDVLAFVLSRNLHRRHLSESQRACIAAEIANMAQGHRTDKEPSLDLAKVDTTTPISQTEAAKMLNVGRATVGQAIQVKKKGTQKIQEAVKEGKLKMNTASKIVDLPTEEQDEIADSIQSNGKRKKAESTDVSWPKMLKWACRRKYVTKEDLHREFGLNLPDCGKKLSTMSQSRGYIAKDLGDGEYKISEAVHFVLIGTEEQPDLPELMKMLYRKALSALRIDNDSTSCEWSRKDRIALLEEILRITGPFAK
jgi:ParB-like chromosome segregation protein Spo0J